LPGGILTGGPSDHFLESLLGVKRHRTPRVRHDQDPVDTEDVHREDQRLEGSRRDPTARVAEYLGVPGLEAHHLERSDAGVHTGNDGDPGMGNPIEAAQLKIGCELSVRGEKVVEARG
jgi:hypothetical protein